MIEEKECETLYSFDISENSKKTEITNIFCFNNTDSSLIKGIKNKLRINKEDKEKKLNKLIDDSNSTPSSSSNLYNADNYLFKSNDTKDNNVKFKIIKKQAEKRNSNNSSISQNKQNVVRHKKKQIFKVMKNSRNDNASITNIPYLSSDRLSKFTNYNNSSLSTSPFNLNSNYKYTYKSCLNNDGINKEQKDLRNYSQLELEIICEISSLK